MHKKRKISKPETRIAVTFLAFIIGGTLLFMLPFMTRDGKGLSIIRALFTATSSVCVTGLTLIDPAVTLSRWGQMLLLVLIEFGGISLVSFASFFMFSFKKKNGLRRLRLAREYTNIDSLSQTRALIKTIIGVAFFSRLFGAVCLMAQFVPQYGSKGIWISIFTACSAYCNAGFDIFGTAQTEFSSIVPFNRNPFVILVVSLMVILGGIGFFVFLDLITFRKDHRLSLHTRIVVVFTLLLLALGTILIFAFEFSNSETIGNMDTKNKLLNSFFTSVSARTAGFASVDMSKFLDFSKIFMLFLMFIGAGTGSTGGGIKVTTFAVLFMTVVSVILNKNDTIVMGKKIDRRIVAKSLSIAVLGVGIVLILSTILTIDNPDIKVIDALFEATSAFATVGISVGVTGSAHLPGLIALIVTMFIGRLGPICFITTLASKEKASERSRIYPEGRIMVG